MKNRSYKVARRVHASPSIIDPPATLLSLEMLLSGAMSVLTLVVTIARAAALTFPALNHSTNHISGRGPGSCSPPDRVSQPGKKSNLLISRHDEDRYIQCLDEYLLLIVQDPEMQWRGTGPISHFKLTSNEWASVSPLYENLYAAFEAAIWRRYPSMETHIKRVFHVVLTVRFYEYNSLGQLIGSTTRGGLVDPMELEIARAVLKRETIARESKDKEEVSRLANWIGLLVNTWRNPGDNGFGVLKTEYRAIINKQGARWERAVTYHRMALTHWGGHEHFIFYATHRDPPVGEEAEVEAYIQLHVGKYLKPEMFETHDTSLLRYIDDFLNRKVRPSGPQTLMPERISDDDEYARLQELFMALWVRQMRTPHRKPRVESPFVSRFADDATEGMNVLEAEICRKFALTTVDEDTDRVDTINCYLAIIRLGEMWSAAGVAELFVPAGPVARGNTWVVDTMEHAKARLRHYLDTQEVPQNLQDEVSQAIS